MDSEPGSASFYEDDGKTRLFLRVIWRSTIQPTVSFENTSQYEHEWYANPVRLLGNRVKKMKYIYNTECRSTFILSSWGTFACGGIFLVYFFSWFVVLRDSLLSRALMMNEDNNWDWGPIKRTWLFSTRGLRLFSRYKEVHMLSAVR